MCIVQFFRSLGYFCSVFRVVVSWIFFLSLRASVAWNKLDQNGNNPFKFVRDAEDKVHLILIGDADKVAAHRNTISTCRALICCLRLAWRIIAFIIVGLPAGRTCHTWTKTWINILIVQRTMSALCNCLSSEDYYELFVFYKSTVHFTYFIYTQ